MSKPTADAPFGCALRVQQDAQQLRLFFEIANRSSAPRMLRYYRPFVQFTLQASVQGQTLQLLRRDMDVPGELVERALPAGETTTIESPVVVRFSKTMQTASDAMVWTFVGQPDSAELRATLQLEGDQAESCSAHVQPTQGASE